MSDDPRFMVGMTRAELDRAEAGDRALGRGPARPVDSASLILIDRRGGIPHVLMGRRSSRHAFMPGKFVFPGGRTDPGDSRIRPASELEQAETAKLTSTPGRRISAARARAIALSAVRELYEEAGYLIGSPGQLRTRSPGWSDFMRNGLAPALSPLRFVARAVTPPGRLRRFDTRFLAAPASAVALQLDQPTEELEELAWLPLPEALEADIPGITRVILQELVLRLKSDPQLRPGGTPVPSLIFRAGRFQRSAT